MYTAAKVWNALPPAITSLPSLGAFKRALKTELFADHTATQTIGHSSIDITAVV